jgi:hypothetical protein
MITAAIMVVVLIGLGATSGIAGRTMQTNERRADTCERVLRCFQRIRQFTRAGVLSTYKVEATPADVTAGRATAVGTWIDPVDGEQRTAVQFRAADGNLAMNAASLTPPIEVRFRLDEREDPALNPQATVGEDDDRDGLIDEGRLEVVYDGTEVGLVSGISSCWLILDRAVMTVQVTTATTTASDRQFFFEQSYVLRNN